MSFEELRAQARGWTSRNWATEETQADVEEPQSQAQHDKFRSTPLVSYVLAHVEHSPGFHKSSKLGMNSNFERSKNERPKKTKIREVKAETQTGKM